MACDACVAIKGSANYATHVYSKLLAFHCDAGYTVSVPGRFRLYPHRANYAMDIICVGNASRKTYANRPRRKADVFQLIYVSWQTGILARFLFEINSGRIAGIRFNIANYA